MVKVAAEAEGTVVERLTESARFFKNEMVFYLPGYGSAVFLQLSCDGLKGEGRIKGMLNYKTGF